MPCYNPIQAFSSKRPDGKLDVKFSNVLAKQFAEGVRFSNISDKLSLPCGRCRGCRLERSRQWAVRCMYEASLHVNNCFITLTYDDEHLPRDRSLDKSHFQKFFKKLRKKYGSGIRYFHCGEYGESFDRPHYHACVFGFDFPDKRLHSMSNGQPLYVSDQLARLWKRGFCLIGALTFESAAYVSRYIMKKRFGDDAKEHYLYVHQESGEIFNRIPEYCTMSRRPGIGHAWFAKFKKDVFPSDFLVVNGRKCKPPRYFDSLFEKENPSGFEALKLRRQKFASRRSEHSTFKRLKVREEVLSLRLKRLVRSL